MRRVNLPSRIFFQVTTLFLLAFMQAGFAQAEMAQNTVENYLQTNQLAGNKANSLIHQNSPYLLQHAYNPVQWYAWGEDAFEQARQFTAATEVNALAIRRVTGAMLWHMNPLRMKRLQPSLTSISLVSSSTVKSARILIMSIWRLPS